MRLRTLFFTIPVTVLATIITVVACGPKKNYVPVELMSRGSFRQSFKQCADRMSRIRAIKVGETKDTPPPKFHLCEAASGDDAASAAAYAWHERELRYTIRSGAKPDTYLIGLKIAVGMPASTDIDSMTKLGRALHSCVERIGKVWKKSTSDDLELSVEFETLGYDQKSVPDQQLLLVSAGASSYKMQHWPNGSALSIDAASAGNKDLEKCDRLLGADAQAQCKAPFLDNKNQSFCADLARFIGYSVGLTGPASLDRSCGPLPSSDDESFAAGTSTLASGSAKSSATSTRPPASTYMIEGDDFFSKARLSKSDVQMILGKACAERKEVVAGPLSNPVTGSVSLGGTSSSPSSSSSSSLANEGT